MKITNEDLDLITKTIDALVRVVSVNNRIGMAAMVSEEDEIAKKTADMANKKIQALIKELK